MISEIDVADETLDKLKNLVVAVFYFEMHNEAEKISLSVDKVIAFLEKENIIDIRVWLGNTFRSELSLKQIGRINSIKEAKSILSELADNLREEGREEEKEITTKKMLKEGFDIETISRITNLSINEINKL